MPYKQKYSSVCDLFQRVGRQPPHHYPSGSYKTDSPPRTVRTIKTELHLLKNNKINKKRVLYI
jgi:hypothetical protein